VEGSGTRRWKAPRIEGAVIPSRGRRQNRSRLAGSESVRRRNKASRSRESSVSDGVSEVRSCASARGRKRPASKQGARPTEAGQGAVKHPSLRMRSGKTARRSETDEARVLVDRVMGSRSRSDASCVVRARQAARRVVDGRASRKETKASLTRALVGKWRRGARGAKRNQTR